LGGAGAGAGDRSGRLHAVAFDAFPVFDPRPIYGFEREEADMVKITRRLAAGLAAHRDDRSEERLDD